MKNLEWTTEMPTKENIGERFLLVADGIDEQVVQIRYNGILCHHALYIEYNWYNPKGGRDADGDMEWDKVKAFTDLKNALWFGPIPEIPNQC